MKFVEINSKDLEYNVNKIKEKAGDSKVIAVVKGNGYGLGIKEYVKFLFEHGINYFAVSSVEEAVEVSKFEFDINVLCMEATSVEDDVELLLDSGVIITVDNLEIAKYLDKKAGNKNTKARVHIKLDTGFSRYGFDIKDKIKILDLIKTCKNLYVEGVYSHFSTAYFADSNYTWKQYNRFLEIKKYLEENDVKIDMYHIANSSAFMKYPDTYLDAVRVGSAFLGRLSVENKLDLRKIGNFKSNVVSIRNVEKGSAIGYSNSVIAKDNMRVGIVPVGYSDGFNVGPKNDTFKFVDKLRICKDAFRSIFKNDKIFVNIKGKRYNVVGRVGMNHIAVDITNSNVNVDDVVWLDTNPILVNSRIERKYI